MRPRLGRDPTLRRLLDAVVPDRLRCVERVGHVLSGDVLDEAGVERMSDPEPGVAVRLELDAHLTALRACVAVGAVEVSGQILYVMPILVSKDVRLRERPAARAELRLELIEESEVDVDIPIAGTVEGPRRRGRRATAGLDAAVEEPRSRPLVPTKRLRPVRLHAVDDGHDAAVIALVRVLPGLAGLRELARRLPARPDRLVGQGPEVAESAATAEEEERENDDDRNEASAAAERHRHAAGKPIAAATAIVLDLRGVELGVLAKAHQDERTLDQPGRNLGRQAPAK